MKKLLSLLLLLCMLVSLLPAAALAAETEPSDTPTAESVGNECSGEPSDVSATEAAPAEEPTPENNASAELTAEAADFVSPAFDIASDEPAAEPALDGAAAKSVYLYVVCYYFDGASVKINGEEATPPCEASVGDEITVTADLLSGYNKVSFDLTVLSGVDIPVTESPTGTFTFTIPEGVGIILLELTFAPADAVTVTYHYDNSTESVFCDPGEPLYLTDLSSGERVITGFAVGSEDGSVLPVNSYHAFTEDTDLYAKYAQGIAVTYHISSAKSVTNYATPGVAYEIRVGEQYDEGYIVAWSDKPDGSGQRYELYSSYVFESDTDLYPIYAQDVVSITYHYGDKTDDYDIVVPRGSLAYIYSLEVIFHGSGLTGTELLKYWAIGSEDSSEKCLAGQEITANEDLDLYAVLAEETVTLTYDYGFGTNRTAEVVVPKGGDVLLRSGSPNTPFGKVFAGWSRTEGGELLGETAVFTEDTTLYAVWGKEVLITYDANGGSGRRQLTQLAGQCIQTPITAGDKLFTRDGYTLTGWSTTADGSSPYDFSKPVEANITLYAIWEGDHSGEAPTENEPSGSVSGTTAKHSPKTGDEALVLLWLTLMGVSALTGGVLLAKKKHFDK